MGLGLLLSSKKGCVVVARSRASLPSTHLDQQLSHTFRGLCHPCHSIMQLTGQHEQLIVVFPLSQLVAPELQSGFVGAEGVCSSVQAIESIAYFEETVAEPGRGGTVA